LAKSTHKAMSDARRELTKFTGKLDAAEKRQKALLNALKNKCIQIANAWVVDIANAGKEDATKQAIGYEALFDKVAGQGSTHIQESAFCRYVEKLPGMTLPAEHGKVISRHLGAEGVSRLAFLKMFQQYWICVKPIAITSVFDISETKTVRRVETNEVIELLEGPKNEEPKEGEEDKAKASQMQRIRGRALLDGAEGWISVKGNQGTPFLRTSLKPCYKAVVDTELECDYAVDSGKAGMLKADDLFELLEGPKEQETVSMRAKVKSMPEGTEGWLTVDKKGGDNKIYKVCSNVVITDSEDIKASKVIKKLEVDDLVILLEGPKEVDGGLTRIKAKATQGDEEGWVTIKGSKGTSYAEASSKHLLLSEDTPLTKNFKFVAKETVKTLKKDTILEVVEGPKEEGKTVMQRVKGRAQRDGAVGWATVKVGGLKKCQA